MQVQPEQNFQQYVVLAVVIFVAALDLLVRVVKRRGSGAEPQSLEPAGADDPFRSLDDDERARILAAQVALAQATRPEARPGVIQDRAPRDRPARDRAPQPPIAATRAGAIQRELSTPGGARRALVLMTVFGPCVANASAER
jgi:hypothetical protein